MNSIKRNDFQGMVKTSFSAIIFSILFFHLNPSFAQLFPVQANINVAPPYSVYLSHYTSPGQEKVMVSVQLTNPTIPSIDVKLRFTIEGAGIRLTTSPAWTPPPFTLSGGVLVSLPQEIIAEYLKPQHLLTEGVNPVEFYRSGKLPEGFYQFKVEVVEYRRNLVISNIGRAMLWLVLNEPPRIVFPLPEQKVMATNPQMLNFTWIPSGASSPLSSLTTQYEFTLIELVDKGIDPTVAITTASNASKYVKVTDQTNLFYGPGEMPLTPGKTYAIRVKAFTSDGLDMFKNGGYSEVRTFRFGDACNAPLSFALKNPKQSGFDISVITDPSNTAWQVRFRETSAGADILSRQGGMQSVPSNPDGGWSELKSEPGTSSKTQKGLKASTKYEVQVKGLCGEIASDYTPSQTITTSPLADANRSCDGNPTPFAADNAPALTKLSVNDLFLAALFPIKVTKVKSQSGGKFTGSGIATLPLFNVGLAVTFENIGINNLMQFTSGEVKVVRNEFTMALIGDDPTKPLVGEENDPVVDPTKPTDPTDHPITDTIPFPPCDSIVFVNDSVVTLYPTKGGDPVTVNLGGSSTTLLVPVDGNMDNAKIVYDGAAHPYTPNQGGSGGNGMNGVSGFLANFRPSEQQVYGFDSMQYAPYTSFYNEMRINGKLVKLPWKALEMGKPDPVNLSIKRSNANYPYTNLKVGVMGGADLLPSAGGDTPKRTYNLVGVTEGEEAIVATFQDSSKTKYAGGIWTATYKNEPFKLYLVPLPGIEISDADRQTLQGNLNAKIFSQAVVSWTVGTLPGITGVDLGDNGLDWADKAMLSSYNAEMNGVISSFKDWKTDIDPDAYYLFIVPKFSEGGVEGFMPRNRRFGFITKEQVAMRTVAHELGHGAFNLKHTFPEVPQGSTKNLMDYSDGLALYKPQWDLIHNPEFTTGLWDGMEDGAIIVERFKFTYDVSKELTEKAHGNQLFVVDNSGAINLFSDALIDEINQKLKEVNNNGQPVFVIVDLFTYTEASDVDLVKKQVDNQIEALKEANSNAIIIAAIGYKLVDKNNVPLQEKPNLLIRSEFFTQAIQGTADFENWRSITATNEAQVQSFINSLIAALPKNPIFNSENCLELSYSDLGIQSAKEISPNDVKSWVVAFAGDNGVTIDYSYTGYPTVNNSEVPTASVNQPENSNADINIAVHFDESGKKIVICHQYKAGAIIIPSVTVSGESLQPTTIDEIVGLSKVYAMKALANAKAGGEKLQALFNSAVKGVIAAKTWTKTICNKMEVPQTCWNDIDHKQAYDRNPFKVEPVTSGVVDGTFDEIKSIPELITLALDVVFDKEVRASLWESIKSISWEDIKNFPVKIVKDKVSTYSKGGSIAKHEGGKDGVAVASMFFGFGSAKKAKELAETVGKNGTDYATALQKAYDEIDVSKIDEFGAKLDNLGGGATGVKLRKIGNTNHTTIATIDKGGNVAMSESEHVFEAAYEIEKKGGAKGYCVLEKVEDGKTVFRETTKEVGELLAKRRKWLNELKANYDFNSPFEPEGKLGLTNISSDLKIEMLSKYKGNPKAEEYLLELVKSGTDAPVARIIKKGEELYKIVPKGTQPKATTPFWFKKSELDNILNKGGNLEKELGLPLNSHAVEYDLYKIKATDDLVVYDSKIAPTKQGNYQTTGGATQSLVINRDNWSLHEYIEPLIPNR